MPVPSPGHEIAFEARIGGGGARGRAQVLRVDHVDDGVGREMVVICDVLELHGAAERVIARAGFRERVVEFATKHRDGEKILEAAGGGLTRRMRPDTIADPSPGGALGLHEPQPPVSNRHGARRRSRTARRTTSPAGHAEAEAPGPHPADASVPPSLGSRQPLQARL